MNKYVYKLMSPSLKNKYLCSKYYRNKEAIRLASSSKRIDICSAQFAHLLHLSKQPSLEGKVCLEIGSGWVLSHAIVCYLLGAK
ncbi:MAG: hypothetical protein GY756_11485 [bacterium]|nr:hypothetical protein [bacterium]